SSVKQSYTVPRQYGCYVNHSGLPGTCGEPPTAGGCCFLCVRSSNQAPAAPFSCELCRSRRRDHISDSSTRCSWLGNPRHQECHPRTEQLYLPGTNRIRQPAQVGQTKSALRFCRGSTGKFWHRLDFPALRGPARVLLSPPAYGRQSRSSDPVRGLAYPGQRFAL